MSLLYPVLTLRQGSGSIRIRLLFVRFAQNLLYAVAEGKARLLLRFDVRPMASAPPACQKAAARSPGIRTNRYIWSTKNYHAANPNAKGDTIPS